MRRLACVVVGIIVVVISWFAPVVGNSAARATVRQPSVLLILTDDQRVDTLFAMRIVRRRLVTPGVSFRHAYASSGVCCPSRASLLTGLYPHHSGVWSNHEPYAFSAFRDRSTIATWLDDAGYRTALIGKYLNGYKVSSKYVPPGWDRWYALQGGYYNYDALDWQEGGNARIRHHGRSPTDYSTRVLTTQARRVISSTPAGTPFFIYLSYIAPHGPATPLRADAHAFDDLPKWQPPSYNERHVSDKPWYVRRKAPLSRSDKRAIQRFRRAQLATLLAVDRSIGRLLDDLRAASRLSNTMVIFTSDQGVLWGEHRLVSKGVPFEEVLHVPLAIRWDGHEVGGRTEDDVSVNIDIPATIAAAAGVPQLGIDGRNLTPLLRHPHLHLHRSTIAEKWSKTDNLPTFCTVRYRSLVFTTNYNGDRSKELYDLRLDPWQLENAVHSKRYSDVLPRLRNLRSKLCGQPPPRA
jgi:arylsulfatase A-like enzyme